MFNAGFFGFNQNAKEILQWLIDTCLITCERSIKKGHFDDQFYLNLLPTHFEGVKILQHRGLNVANWNRIENQRTLCGGRVRINDTFPIVFIHFNPYTKMAIETNKDPLLETLFREYQQTLHSFDIEVSTLKKYTYVHKSSSNRKRS